MARHGKPSGKFAMDVGAELSRCYGTHSDFELAESPELPPVKVY